MKIQHFLNFHGCSFLTLETVTVPKLPKKHPYNGLLIKVSMRQVMVFQNKRINGYQAMINRRLVREGNPTAFQVSRRPWGIRIPGQPLVTHKGRIYLETIVLREIYTRFLVNGNPVPFTEDKQEGNQGGLQDKVIIRCFALDSIRKINGKPVSHE